MASRRTGTGTRRLPMSEYPDPNPNIVNRMAMYRIVHVPHLILKEVHEIVLERANGIQNAMTMCEKYNIAPSDELIDRFQSLRKVAAALSVE
jgi:hypothetical protein